VLRVLLKTSPVGTKLRFLTPLGIVAISRRYDRRNQRTTSSCGAARAAWKGA